MNTLFRFLASATLGFRMALEQVGEAALLAVRALRASLRRPLEGTAIVYQMEQLGVQSIGLVTITSLFIGMVMTAQFAFGLERFGGLEYIPRVVVMSFARELAPSLTAVIVGSRIGSGIAAEIGAMNVTEQVDAIRALGADPIKKLVLPRLVAATLVMPMLSAFALVMGVCGGILVCWLQYDMAPEFFLRTGIDGTSMPDWGSGAFKTPFFGFLVALIGCHHGLRTHGGTEGVGQSTTQSVVSVSIAILLADYLLTLLMQML